MMLQSGLMMNDLQSALSYADYQENGLRNIVYQQALTETGNKDLALDSLKAFDSGIKNHRKG